MRDIVPGGVKHERGYALGSRVLLGSGWVELQHVRPSRLIAHSKLGSVPRSEEHTSELQSQSKLACGLLLDKKKKLMQESVQLKLGLAICAPFGLFVSTGHSRLGSTTTVMASFSLLSINSR